MDDDFKQNLNSPNKNIGKRREIKFENSDVASPIPLYGPSSDLDLDHQTIIFVASKRRNL